MEHLTQLAAISGTLILLWFTLQALKRLRVNNEPMNRVSVQQRVPLANGCQLVVVRWDDRELLLATGNHPCTVVASKPATIAAPQAEVSSAWAR